MWAENRRLRGAVVIGTEANVFHGKNTVCKLTLLPKPLHSCLSKRDFKSLCSFRIYCIKKRFHATEFQFLLTGPSSVFAIFIDYGWH